MKQNPLVGLESFGHIDLGKDIKQGLAALKEALGSALKSDQVKP